MPEEVKSVGCPEAGERVIGCCNMGAGLMKTGPKEEHYVFVTTKPFLQAPIWAFLIDLFSWRLI